MSEEAKVICGVCKLAKDPDDVVPGQAVRASITELIRKDHPDWNPESPICRDDLNRYRAQYVQGVLEAEKGDLSVIEAEVVESLREGDVLTRDVNQEFEEKRTLGQRLLEIQEIQTELMGELSEKLQARGLRGPGDRKEP